MDPGFGPQTTSSQLTRLQIQPTTQQRPVHNVDHLHTLALLAERAPRVCTHQTVSVGGSQQRHHGYDVSREAPEPAAADMMPFSNHQLETKPIFPMVVTEPTSTALPTNASLESDKTVEDIGMRRTMGRIRYFNENLGSYGPWKDIFGGSVGDTESIITLNLSRGGMLRILCNILPQNKRKDLSRAMHDCKLYRQYSLSRNNDFMGFQEPRSHVLLSSRAKATLDNDEVSDNERHQPGYSYHGVNMKAHPIDLVPEVASYAEELATRYNLPRWDIGVDMIAYKDGGDSIGWHADDTQGESVVVCVVVDAPGEVRPLCIRPKRTKQLGHGDEEIQLFIAEGDGYDMDGYMQESYEHSLPKKLKNNSHRFVLIFRHGNTLFVPQDSGVSVLNNNSVGSNSGEEWNLVSAISKLRPKTCTTNFGHPTDVIVGECYSRRFLWTTFAHRSDQRGIK
jgi:alkylated DNA repair dioxygenase AlkB